MTNRWNATVAIPEIMQAVLLTGHGGLEKLVVVDDHPVPVPASTEVLIKVAACGMNNTDVWVRETCRQPFYADNAHQVID